MTPSSLTARYSRAYAMIVLGVTAALCGLVLWMVWGQGMGWSILTRDGQTYLNVTSEVVKLVLLTLLMAAVFVTQAWDCLRPQTLLIVSHASVYDRRLTRGPVRWEQVQSVHVYRKGWQWVATLTLMPSTLDRISPDLGLGPMPLYAFNRLCARWLKRPELNIHMGGLTVPSDEILRVMRLYAGSKVIVEID